MTDVLDEKVKEAIKGQIALGRYGKPEEVASTISFLASEDASYISGQVIVIDGCLSMQYSNKVKLRRKAGGHLFCFGKEYPIFIL